MCNACHQQCYDWESYCATYSIVNCYSLTQVKKTINSPTLVKANLRSYHLRLKQHIRAVRSCIGKCTCIRHAIHQFTNLQQTLITTFVIFKPFICH